MKDINGQQLRDLVAANDQIQVIDVRTEEEIREGMIEGAVNINLMGGDFAEKIKALDRAKPYIMVCRSGGRSGSACGFMAQEGFKEIYNLAGGMMAWDGEVA